MLQVRYEEPNELDICGSSTEFSELRAAILELASNTKNERIVVDCDAEFDPRPYRIRLVTIEIVSGTGPSRFSAVGDRLVIEGRRQSLVNLAGNLPCEEPVSPVSVQYHIHYDHISFPEYV